MHHMQKRESNPSREALMIILRGYLETIVDKIVQDPNYTRKVTQALLKELNIAPNIQSKVSFWAGYFLGRMTAIEDLLKIDLSGEEIVKLFEIIKRRIHEITQIFLIEP